MKKLNNSKIKSSLSLIYMKNLIWKLLNNIMKSKNYLMILISRKAIKNR
jgi:hypothetical protein